MTRARRRWALLLLLMVLVVNLPLVHSTWTGSRIEGSGVDVTGTVTDHRESSAGHLLSFTFPEEIDPEQRTWQAEVDEATYDDAVDSGRIGVRVLEDDPAAFRADGSVESKAPLVATLLADLVLVLLALLVWRFAGRMRAQLKAVALEDVERSEPGILLERLRGEDYLVRGKVLEIEPDRILLDLGNRTIVVLLDGWENPVGHQQPAQVRARMVA